MDMTSINDFILEHLTIEERQEIDSVPLSKEWLKLEKEVLHRAQHWPQLHTWLDVIKTIYQKFQKDRTECLQCYVRLAQIRLRLEERGESSSVMMDDCLYSHRALMCSDWHIEYQSNVKLQRIRQALESIECGHSKVSPSRFNELLDQMNISSIIDGQTMEFSDA